MAPFCRHFSRFVANRTASIFRQKFRWSNCHESVATFNTNQFNWHYGAAMLPMARLDNALNASIVSPGLGSIFNGTVVAASAGAIGGVGLCGTQQVVDDELRRILEPCDGSMNLLEYYDLLRAAGFTNNAKLRTLTTKTLKENKIKMKAFHEKELLKRIAKLK
eukprot:11090_1